ncbi:HET-domain-containing protein [Microthyrium microscopicum]|uniref:HET-domain-containing protein n=1 Tax=Microthyrium microscopicum TaxID=703497 RepID=A0A6A6TXH4_9PEZI|nr:HET-domain-containing protein [Microthyrium microscopicum]
MSKNILPPASVHYPDQLGAGEIRVLRICKEQPIVKYQGLTLGSYILERVPLGKQLRGDSSQSSASTSNEDFPEASPDIDFTALSYVWGSEDDKMKIVLNGAIFEITQNLHVAIILLRSEILKQPIWIDAICINQTNSVEKGFQLAQMADVYRQARKVIVWLGPSIGASDTAMRRACVIGCKALQYGVRPSNEPQEALELKQDPQSEELLSEVSEMVASKDPTQHFPAYDFVKLTYRPWFSRAWILQEVTVAEGEVWIACGDVGLPLDVFAAAVKLVALWLTSELRKVTPAGTSTEEHNQISTLMERIGMSKLVDPFFSAWSLISQFGGPTKQDNPLLPVNPQASMTLGTRWKYWKLRDQGNTMSLMSLLTRNFTLDTTEGLQCREPKDKIYALAGISGDMGFLGDPSRFCDRAWPAHNVYMDTARHLIGLANIDVLSLCREQDPSLPSWVPDWSKRIRQPWSLYRDDGLFHASGVSESRTNTFLSEAGDASSRVLNLNVYRVDSVKTTGLKEYGSIWEAGLDDPFDYKSAGEVFDTVKHFLSLSKRGYTKDAIWRISVGDKETDKQGQFKRASPTFEEAYVQMVTEIRSHHPGKRYLGPAFAAYQNMMLSMHGSTPFLSQQGYVGLCPDTTEHDDVICIPVGSHVPYVFRRSANGTTFRLIGEAYVHGIMDGECIFESLSTEHIILE